MSEENVAGSIEAATDVTAINKLIEEAEQMTAALEASKLSTKSRDIYAEHESELSEELKAALGKSQLSSPIAQLEDGQVLMAVKVYSSKSSEFDAACRVILHLESMAAAGEIEGSSMKLVAIDTDVDQLSGVAVVSEVAVTPETYMKYCVPEIFLD